MKNLIVDIIHALRQVASLDDESLAKIIRKHNRGRIVSEHFSKKQLLPYCIAVKENDLATWDLWQLDKDLEQRLFNTLRVKPRRTASGVATITVITKPWPCSSNCIYCPSDLRMPKSYLSDEPACQRAERNAFDPYLQVASRLQALTHMGHACDKVEVIILGGTWTDYPQSYQLWFVTEIFKALNDADDVRQLKCSRRRDFYVGCSIATDEDTNAAKIYKLQKEIYAGRTDYNTAWSQLYDNNDNWQAVCHKQVATFDELFEQHKINEDAAKRNVGLVIETRPDCINVKSLLVLRSLGCTKIQMGIQSLDKSILAANGRHITLEQIALAFKLLRLFGFKIHIHFMLNLLGASIKSDKQDFLHLVTDARYLPDEIKLYPCALVAGTKLCNYYKHGQWSAYSESELLDVLVTDVLATPAYMRISRMIRDISAKDIVTGNKKANLRQMVEHRLAVQDLEVQEIRYREIANSHVDFDKLTYKEIIYLTTLGQEYFLQWLTDEGKIVGFLRLSLPNKAEAQFLLSLSKDLEKRKADLTTAMIREVHIYGKVAKLIGARGDKSAQHLGLGRDLINKAKQIAKSQGYAQLNVISAIGTRNYYRSLGFTDNDLYQQVKL